MELVREVVEELVGRTGEATGRGEREVCSNEKVGKVLRGDLAGDGVVIAGWAGVSFKTVLLLGESQRSLKTARSMRGLVVPK